MTHLGHMIASSVDCVWGTQFASPPGRVETVHICLSTGPSFNNLYKKNFIKIYTVDDHICAEYIRDIQLGGLTFDSADILNTVLNTVLYSLCCDCAMNVWLC